MSNEMHDLLGAELSRELADHGESSTATASIENVGAAFSRGDLPRFRARKYSRASLLARIAILLRTKKLATLSLAFALTAIAMFGFRSREERSTSPVAKAIEITPDVTRGQRAEVGSVMVAPKEGSLPVSFADGSQMTLLPDTRVRVAEIAPHSRRVVLESGSLRASVVHREDTAWTIGAGPYAIEVTGTRFIVAWEPTSQALDVTIEEGSVVISGCEPNKSQRVGAGKSVHLACAHEVAAPRVTLGPTPNTPPPTNLRRAPPNHEPSHVAIIVDAVTTSVSAAATTTSAPTSAPSTTATAPNDSPPAVLPTIGELLVSADEARFSGHQDVAIEQLLSIRRRAPGSDQAATAVYELGAIYYDGMHDYGRAAESFDLYLRERPNGRLVREALARAAEGYERSGYHATARKLATTYLARFPQGPQAAIAWRIADGTYGEKAP